MSLTDVAPLPDHGRFHDVGFFEQRQSFFGVLKMTEIPIDQLGPTRLLAHGTTTCIKPGNGHEGEAAVVARGMLREFAFTARTTYQGRTTGGKGRIRFSHFGTVPPIEAPPADEVTDMSDLSSFLGVDGLKTA